MGARGSRLRRVHWGWLLFKLVLGFGWTHAMLLFTPASLSTNLSPTAVGIWTIGTALGAFVSLVGMAFASSDVVRQARLGLAVEIVGIILLAGGPLQYLLIQVGFITTDFAARYALAWFAAAMLVAVGIRLFDVVRRLRRATTPLPGGGAA